MNISPTGGIGLLGRIKNLLGSVFNLFAKGGSTGGVVVRKPGGTPGVQEVQVSNDGSNTLIQSMVGEVQFLSAGGYYARLSSSLGFYLGIGSRIDVAGDSGGFRLDSSGIYRWASSSTDASAVTDTGLSRVAAGVLGATQGEAGPGVYSVPLAQSGQPGNPAELRATPAASGSGAAGGNVVLTPGAGDGAGAAGVVSCGGAVQTISGSASAAAIGPTAVAPNTGIWFSLIDTVITGAGINLFRANGNNGGVVIGNYAKGYGISSTGDATGAPDTCLARDTAAVWKLTDGSSGKGWLQNSAGRARNTADVTNATATMANLADLTITLIAGRKYTGRLVLIAKNSTGAEGLQFDCNGGTATMTSFGMTAEETPIGATLGVTDSTSLGTALTDTVVSTGYTIYAFNLTMVVNAGGTFIPRFAEVSHTAGTATVRLGSYIWLEDSPN